MKLFNSVSATPAVFHLTTKSLFEAACTREVRSLPLPRRRLRFPPLGHPGMLSFLSDRFSSRLFDEAFLPFAKVSQFFRGLHWAWRRFQTSVLQEAFFSVSNLAILTTKPCCKLFRCASRSASLSYFLVRRLCVDLRSQFLFVVWAAADALHTGELLLEALLGFDHATHAIQPQDHILKLSDGSLQLGDSSTTMSSSSSSAPVSPSSCLVSAVVPFFAACCQSRVAARVFTGHLHDTCAIRTKARANQRERGPRRYQTLFLSISLALSSSSFLLFFIIFTDNETLSDGVGVQNQNLRCLDRWHGSGLEDLDFLRVRQEPLVLQQLVAGLLVFFLSVFHEPYSARPCVSAM